MRNAVLRYNRGIFQKYVFSVLLGVVQIFMCYSILFYVLSGTLDKQGLRN